MIGSEDHVPRRTVRLVGRRVSVATAGSGPILIFLHGTGTYSYAWRNIIPFLSNRYHCIAPDLPGTGKSDLEFPSGASSYSFSDQLEVVDMLIESEAADRPIAIIGHELGAAMAVQIARRNPDQVAALVLVEGVFRISNDEIFDSDVRKLLSDLRGSSGEQAVLIENRIVEEYLPRLTARMLSEYEMDAYRAPYEKPGEARRAMLAMIRQLPLLTSAGPIDDLVNENRLWCAQSRTPKLVIGGNPGFLVPPSVLGTAARWSNTRVGSVRGLHYVMEDSPARLTSSILDWLEAIPFRR